MLNVVLFSVHLSSLTSAGGHSLHRKVSSKTTRDRDRETWMTGHLTNHTVGLISAVVCVAQVTDREEERERERERDTYRR